MLSYIYKLTQFSLYFVGCFVLVVVLYLLVAVVVSKIQVPAESDHQHDIDLFLLTNGVHTDLVVPVQTEMINWVKYVPFEHIRSKETAYEYLALGWGDKGFYLETPRWEDLKFTVAFKAAFGLSNSAIHATYYEKMVEGENCVRIPISKNQYKRLVAYILGSFCLDESGGTMCIDTSANYCLRDAFYEASGRYTFYYTCNSWANDGLKACGLKASKWALFDSGIFQHYK